MTGLKQKSTDKFKDLNEVKVYEHNGAFKYTSGNESSYEAAIRLQNQIRLNKKYRDAFIVAFDKGVRIDLEEAKKLSGN
jgi:hypothetical protein